MVFITDKNLIKLLDDYLSLLLKDAHPYTEIQTVLQRLLDKCANILNINIEWYSDKDKIFIHPDNMKKIDLKWQSLTKIKHDEINVYKRLKYSDYVDTKAIEKFINILKSKNEHKFLSELLSIDGFDNNIKSYIVNLKVGGKGFTHIHCIRNIYKTFPDCPVKIVYLTLLNIYERLIKDDEVQQLMKTTRLEIEKEIQKDDSLIEKITDMYVSNIDNLKIVAVLKIAQLKIQKKKMKKSAQLKKQKKRVKKSAQLNIQKSAQLKTQKSAQLKTQKKKYAQLKTQKKKYAQLKTQKKS